MMRLAPGATEHKKCIVDAITASIVAQCIIDERVAGQGSNDHAPIWPGGVACCDIVAKVRGVSMQKHVVNSDAGLLMDTTCNHDLCLEVTTGEHDLWCGFGVRDR